MRSRWASGLIALALCVSAAEAQVSTPEQERTLARMMAAPTDHQRTFDYVRASVDARDYEAAIGALERLLAYNPGLTRAKYELGVLHYRMGSYALALQYFEDVVADPTIDLGLRRRAEAYLPDARKQASSNRFTGTLFAGLRYNSNVAGVPDGGLIRSQGVNVQPTGPFTGRGDGSAVLMGDVSHTYDFKTERALTWETTAVGYGAALFEETRLNHAFFDISTGPRFALFSDPLVGITLRPFVAGGSSMIDGDRYISSIGGGASLGIPLTAFFSISPTIEGRSVSVNNVAPVGSLGTINSGELWTGSLAARWSPMDGVTVDGRGFYAANNADISTLDSNQAGVGLSVKIDFAPPTEAIGYDWSLTIFARYTETRFDEPNPIVDPFVARRDKQTRVGAQLDMPIDPRFGFSVLGQYTNNDSNLPNFRADAWSVMAGPTLRF